jgi:SAM-dependent methyltransferase
MEKIVLSRPKNGEYVRIEILKSGEMYQAAKYTATQVFHDNIASGGLDAYVDSVFGAVFSQYNAWDGSYEYMRRITKKGKILETKRKCKAPPTHQFISGTFDRAKNHILQASDLPVSIKSDKLVQVNRFLEILSDEIRNIPENTHVNVIDFGCGKSYLTFALWHWLKHIRRFNVQICGLDLKPKIIENCAKIADKHSMQDINFTVGSIGMLEQPPMQSWSGESAFNIVISLHACDTATDDALKNAVKWGAHLICAVPCCQHNMRKNMRRNASILYRYNLIEERFAALATDAMRAAWLETQGYRVDIIEFTPHENTAKNLLIRARSGGKSSKSAASALASIIAETGYTLPILKE